jgi:V/A-type H+/Na+-transporting ATPase subunit I
LILKMAKLRLLGPAAALDRVLAALQDLGVVHLGQPSVREGLAALEPSPAERRLDRAIRGAVEDAEAACAQLAKLGQPARPAPAAPSLARAVLVARRTRRALERLADRRATLGEEREILGKYRRLLAGFESLLSGLHPPYRVSAVLIVLRRGDATTLANLRRGLEQILGNDFTLRTRSLDGREVGVLLLVPASRSAKVEALLSAASVEPIPVPSVLGGGPVLEAIPRLRQRLAEIDEAMAEAERQATRVAETRAPELEAARRSLHDRAQALEARALAARTPRAFVLEGWVPAAEVERLTQRLSAAFGADVAVDVEAREEWAAEQAPVVLRNPRLFRPFEAVLKLVPLPRYGSVDPTPFIAVFFPMLFGIAVGDIGYGIALALLALLVRVRSRPGTLGRSIAAIAGACAAFTVVFGAVFGELLGDLGRRFGLPVLFDRAEAILPFLIGTVALGAVHLLLGMFLGVLSALPGRPRLAWGRGVATLMLILVIVALLAALRVLPHRFFTPAAIAVLAGFPVLVVLEGIAALIELLSTLGRILSYARVMALGTASVMLAMIANRMAGIAGSAIIGVVFALLFHSVSFAIAVFSPTIHVLRLHYVEFFGTFFSPGGIPYRPLAHWSPARPA